MLDFTPCFSGTGKTNVKNKLCCMIDLGGGEVENALLLVWPQAV